MATIGEVQSEEEVVIDFQGARDVEELSVSRAKLPCVREREDKNVRIQEKRKPGLIKDLFSVWRGQGGLKSFQEEDDQDESEATEPGATCVDWCCMERE